jgi:hypothetical protein
VKDPEGAKRRAANRAKAQGVTPPTNDTPLKVRLPSPLSLLFDLPRMGGYRVPMVGVATKEKGLILRLSSFFTVASVGPKNKV